VVLRNFDIVCLEYLASHTDFIEYKGHSTVQVRIFLERESQNVKLGDRADITIEISATNKQNRSSSKIKKDQ